MRIVVTGTTGFIGRRVAAHLVAQGHAVVAVGRRPAGIDGVTDIVLPALEAGAVDEALGDASCDGLLHLAAAGVHPGDRDGAELMRVNAVLPAELAAVAARRGARAMVVAGSSAEYAPASPGTRLSEDAPLESGRLYGATKAAGSLLACARANALGLPLGVLRLFNVYGPGEAPHRLLPTLIERLGAGERVPLSPGTQVRDFVYVDDAVQGLVALFDALASRRARGGPYNLATGEGHSVADFARAVARVMRRDESLLDFGALPLRPDDVPYLVGDADRLARETGFRAATGLEAGIRRTVAETGADAASCLDTRGRTISTSDDHA